MVCISVVRMRLTLLIAIVCVVGIEAKITKKSQKDVSLPPSIDKAIKESTTLKKSPQKAIIAIEIINPNDNTTTGKGRKRTIDSSLGYGYQNFFSVQQKPPKYEVYKYSQQDIPRGSGGHTPALAHVHAYSSPQVRHPGEFEIQKSVQYDLGSTQPQFIPHKQKLQQNLNQYYQNGATLFSTVDQNGHVGSLSNHVPQAHDSMVPVIILRVYTNQLNQPGSLHANIPQSHPYANLNSINLQGLLSGYAQKNVNQGATQNYQQPQQYTQYQQPQQEYQQTYPNYQEYQQPQPQYQYKTQHDYQQTQEHTHDDVETQENYPDDAHTKVIFHKNKPIPKETTKGTNKLSAKYRAPAVEKTQPQKFKITVPEGSFSKVEIQDHSYATQMQAQEPQEQLYYYPQQQEQQTQYYQPQAQPQQAYQYQTQQDYQDPKYAQYQQQYVAQAVAQDTGATQYQQADTAQYQQADTAQYQQHDATQYQQQDASQYQQQDATQYQPADATKYQQQDATQYQSADAAQYQYEQPQEQPKYVHYMQQSYEQPQQYVQQYEQQQYDPQQYEQVYEQPKAASESVKSKVHSAHEEDIKESSNEAGRDLHPKVYNYHAQTHGGEDAPHTQKTRSTNKRKRVRRPLVLAPEILDSSPKNKRNTNTKPSQ